MLIEKYFHDLLIGIEAIFANKVKSMLTALGIIFGVAAVISMMAIGNGAQQEILEQIKMVGVNNIVISPIDMKADKDNGEQGKESDGKKKFSRGLTMLDVTAMQQVVPTIEKLSPVITSNYSVIIDGKSKPVTLEGVGVDYFDIFNINIEKGEPFDSYQDETGQPVCLIGNNIKNEFFKQENPIGKQIKVGQNWLTVIGIVERRDFTASASDEMGISSSDNKVFIPVNTLLLRYKNRGLVRADEIEKAGARFFMPGQSTEKSTDESYNQLDKVIVQVKQTEQLSGTANVLKKMLLRRHSGLYDFEVTIPELLLKQQQRTKNIFNIVLGAIAGISLIVGGIGIMNIMLASVMERIREIGTRQAIGASRKDIIVQFLSESTLISLFGGIIGILLGVILSKLVTTIFDIKTIISFFSIIISFGVSAAVGIIFGYLPARRAAEKDPVESLRY